MLDIFKIHPELDKQFKLKQKTVYLKNSTDSYNAYLVSKRFETIKKTVFVVCPNLYEAQKYYDTLTNLNDQESVLFYPADETLTSIMALGSPEFKNERLYTLRRLLTNEAFLVVTTMQGLSQIQLKPEDYLRAVKHIHKNDTYELKDLTNFLVTSGYQNQFTVENPGEFSLRGHILDIFPVNQPSPFRLDFFDNELEQIKIFNVEDQRSFAETDHFEIAPIHELFYTDKMREQALKQIQKHFSAFELSERETEKYQIDLESLSLRQKLDTLHLYIPFFNSDPTTILDFTKEYELYFIDVSKMQLNQQHIEDDLETFATTMSGRAFLSLPYRLHLDKLLKNPHIEIDNYGLTRPDAFHLGVIEVNNYQSNLRLLLQDIIAYQSGYSIYLCVSTQHYFNEVKTFLQDNQVTYERQIHFEPGVYLLDISSHGSFISTHDKIIVMDETELFQYRTRRAIRYRSVLNQSTKIRHVDDLTVGQYVVHYDYGIGQYLGLKTMELSGEKRDYLHIMYANSETLYVPMDQIDMVLKYSNYEGHQPKLSKMGGKAWGTTKAIARKRIKDLSDRLLNLYAQREQSTGHAFSKDNEMMTAFVRDFQYETTKDQEKAIIQTTFDMEQERPMDRLIAGDVGFGKTEVALRAAFKAVLDQKQVLYLVPTTVLARQHYYTFKERFDKYGANVALLSRFVTPKQTRDVIDKLSKGLVDVVIGTHRLLSDDVVFKDLGLLIIDEEHRFGVEHKEKIREIKTNVDTLQLSATPIPRTLQMSLMGLKDLSMIETPPLNRYPVQTYVVERQNALIKEAISREIARGGQVFYLFNQVRGIEGMTEKLKKLIPHAKIHFAHGKMSREGLENVISDFIDHHFDVLVSTTIIETGVDIPNTNTLIIHDADKLGLSQLYQIRGRVGRSDRIAYAYLLYEPNKLINDEAKKRLATIQDFTELGSGYKIAMRDLSIRGAGDILGAEQSGFIDSVGIDLYTKLLEEAMTGESLDKPKSTEIDEVYAARHVDPDYVSEDSVRIEIHKRISGLNKIADVEDLKFELTDRFGNLSPDLVLYMYEKLYKKLSHQLGVHKTQVSAHQVTMTLSLEASSKIDGLKLFKVAERFKQAPVQLNYNRGYVSIVMNLRNAKEHWLYLADQLIENYMSH